MCPEKGPQVTFVQGGGGGKERKGEGEAPSKKNWKLEALNVISSVLRIKKTAAYNNSFINKYVVCLSTLSSQNAIAATYVSETQTSEPAP